MEDEQTDKRPERGFTAGESGTEAASEPRSHVNHEWPVADENFCSCCRGRFMHGLDNIVRIQTTPERQLSLDGQERGVENRKALYKAYLHTACWKRHFGQTVECEKCGVFSKAKKLSNGAKNTCGCVCHDGANRCGYVIDPYTINGMTRKDNGR